MTREIPVQIVLDIPKEKPKVIHAGITINGEIPVAISGYCQTRPSVMYRPSLSPDGDQWCALYGENLQEGVAGFGRTPAEAMADFDQAWTMGIPPKVQRLLELAQDLPCCTHER